MLDIMKELQTDSVVMYHILALWQNQEWRAELEARANGGSDEEVDFGDKPPAQKQTPLQYRIKRFEHLRKTLHQK